MFFFITAFIMVTIAIAALLLAPQLEERRVVFDAQPDRPCAFGPDMAWLAIRAGDPVAVMSALGIESAQASNWNSGLGTIYDSNLGQRRVFVSAPVDGWIFVVSSALPHRHGRAFLDKCTPFLTELSERFGEVQYFAAFPDVDMFAWAKLVSGRFIRAFAVGDEGVVWDRGRTTREERTLGLRLFELRGVRGRRGDAGGELLMHPTREHVMRLAGAWSVNPTLLDSSKAAPSRGYVAPIPSCWMPERLRKSA